MLYNLLRDPLFPVLTAGGERRMIRFADLGEQGPNAPVDFDWPRPDLTIASHELCIGMLAVMYQPDEDGWNDLWNNPRTLRSSKRVASRFCLPSI